MTGVKTHSELLAYHLLAAPELTREQSAIFRIKGEQIYIF